MGYLSVAVFFFLNGYGLAYSQKTNNDYLNCFIKKRIVPFYITNLFVAFIYYVFKRLILERISLREIVLTFLWGGSLIVHGWYLQTLLIFYIIFYVSYIIFREPNKRRMSLTVGGLCYCLLCCALKYSPTWYQSIFAFNLGILWCDYKEQFDLWIEKKWLLGISLFATSTCGLYIVSFKNFFGNAIGLVSKMMSACTFVVVVVLLIFRVNFNNTFSRYLGKYYYEIYVSQGFFLLLFSRYSISSSLLFPCLVLICTLITAPIIHYPIVIIKTYLKGKLST